IGPAWEVTSQRQGGQEIAGREDIGKDVNARSVGDLRLDRRARVVADSAILGFEALTATQLGERAGEVRRRFREAKRGPGQGGDQAEQEHRTTQGRILLDFPSTRNRRERSSG